MTNLELITFNVVMRHSGGERSIVTVDAYDVRGAEYRAREIYPLAIVISSSPVQMFSENKSARS